MNSSLEPQEPLLTRWMRDMTKEERAKIMAAVETLSEYCRTDLEMQEWRALDAEDFYDVDH